MIPWCRSDTVREELVVCCDEGGDRFKDEKEMKKAKQTGKAYIKTTGSYEKINVTGLPSPSDLTGDPDWDEGGKLLEQYDLKLDSRAYDNVSIGFKDELTMYDNPPENDDLTGIMDKFQEDYRSSGQGHGKVDLEEGILTFDENETVITNDELFTFPIHEMGGI